MSIKCEDRQQRGDEEEMWKDQDVRMLERLIRGGAGTLCPGVVRVECFWSDDRIF
jgi:hypothetical protein